MSWVASNELLAEAGQAEIDIRVGSDVRPGLACVVAAIAGGKDVADEKEKQHGRDGRELELHDVDVCGVWYVVEVL